MKKLIIAIVIVIIAVGSSVFFYASKDKKINETIDAIEDKNVKQVFKNSTYQSKNDNGEVEMTDRPIKIYDSLGVKAINIKDRDIKKVSKNKKQVTAKYELQTNYGKINRDVKLNFIKEDKDWKLDWNQNEVRF